MGSAVQYIVLVTIATSCSLLEARRIDFRGKVTCPPQNCSKRCDFGFMRDDNNCILCACKPSPNAIDCPAIECPKECANGYQEDADGCTMCECKSKASIDSLSRQDRSQTCPPNCFMYCRYGNKLDDNGCPICECKTKEETCGTRRCKNYCPDGYKEDDRGCDTCKCQPSSSSSSSSSHRVSSGSSSRRRGSSRSSSSSSRKRCNERLQCTMHCPSGFKRDEQGCEICECQESAGQQPISRVIESSSGVGTFGDRNDRSDTTGGPKISCPRKRCPKRCVYGYVKDTFGCDTCACNSRSRSRVIRPSPLCPVCDNYCPLGRQRGSDGCESCTCNDPPTIPPNLCITCRMHCEHGFVEKPDGCFECKCKPAPVATPPLCIMCPMYCEHGFKKKPDGCEECACNDPPQ